MYFFQIFETQFFPECARVVVSQGTRFSPSKKLGFSPCDCPEAKRNSRLKIAPRKRNSEKLETLRTPTHADRSKNKFQNGEQSPCAWPAPFVRHCCFVFEKKKNLGKMKMYTKIQSQWDLSQNVRSQNKPPRPSIRRCQEKCTNVISCWDCEKCLFVVEKKMKK